MREFLIPISTFYAIALKIRHKMFDWGILRTRSISIPSICVGNLELGGTGKTPLTEYVTKLLMDDRKVAIVSGGYKRKSKEIVIANSGTSLDELGDEPMQYHCKFGDRISVAVGKDRANVIERLLKKNSPDVIILDDAFQHRKISAGLNILTTNYLDPFFSNHLIPAGTLRDLKCRAKAADIIIINKTPDEASEEEKDKIRENLRQYGQQNIYFASLAYGKPIACNAKAENTDLQLNSKITALCGIAQPEYFITHLGENYDIAQKLIFSDHHDFNENDIEKMKKASKEGKIIVTTEKDAMRLTNNHYFSTLKEIPVYYIPIEVRFSDEEASQLRKEIFDYVADDKRSGSVS